MSTMIGHAAADCLMILWMIFVCNCSHNPQVVLAHLQQPPVQGRRQTCMCLFFRHALVDAASRVWQLLSQSWAAVLRLFLLWKVMQVSGNYGNTRSVCGLLQAQWVCCLTQAKMKELARQANFGLSSQIFHVSLFKCQVGTGSRCAVGSGSSSMIAQLANWRWCISCRSVERHQCNV